MAELLFVGGPWHGKTHEIDELCTELNVPISMRDKPLRDEQGVPLLFDHVLYQKRKLGATTPDGKRYMRKVMVQVGMPPELAMAAIQALLFERWMTEVEPLPDEAA